MSLLFEGERKPKLAVERDPPDMDKALEFATKGRGPVVVSCYLATTVEDASGFIVECRTVEAGLLMEIQANKITTQTAALQYVTDHTRVGFPAAKCIDIIKAHVGTSEKPATWAETLTAAKEEDAGPLAVDAKIVDVG